MSEHLCRQDEGHIASRVGKMLPKSRSAGDQMADLVADFMRRHLPDMPELLPWQMDVLRREFAAYEQNKVVAIPVELAVTHEQHEQLLANRDTDKAINDFTRGVMDAWLADQRADQ